MTEPILETTVKINLSPTIQVDGKAGDLMDFAMEAGNFIVEKAYVDESPGNIGDLKGGIKVKKIRALDYVVESTQKRNGHSYPMDLFTGTYKLKGKPDFGFTTGRVRNGDVAFGIGGIRPNKASVRTVKKIEPRYIAFVSSKINSKL